jgi:hypothetical protein
MTQTGAKSQATPHIVFLSYAHDDNKVPENDFTGWVDFFDKTLSIELLERSLDCKLWRDRRDVDPIAFFDDTILDAVRESQVLVAIVSPRYVEREYCLKELATFIESHGTGTSQSGAEAILKIVKRDLPETDLPEAIRRKAGVAFFRLDQEKNEEIPFYEGFGNHQDREYWRVIRRIGASIENQLANSPQPTLEPSAKDETVFLAVTSSDLAEKWNELRDEFASNGYRIVPNDHSLATQDGDATRDIEAGLKDARLSIHLIGKTAGFTPDGASAPIVHRQFHIAGQQRTDNARLKRFVWLPKDIHTDDSTHASFIEKLQHYGELKEGDEVLNGNTFEDLKTVILSELRGKAKRADGPPDTPSGLRRVYLIYAEEDEEEALKVYVVLTDGGIEVMLPEFAADEQGQQTHHDSQLEGCDGALICYGNASQAFVQQHLDALADRRPAGRTHHWQQRASIWHRLSRLSRKFSEPSFSMP